jgi:CRISPR-associated protein Cas5d
MWTRPDTGAAPVSYPVPTFSAVKGIFESIVRIESAAIIPTKVEICAPIIHHAYTTNYGGPLRKSENIRKGASYQLFATVLVNVCYRFYAEPIPLPLSELPLSDRAKRRIALVTNRAHAYQAMFERRLKRGQFYDMPFLGWREFVPDYVGDFREGTNVRVDINLPIPSMLREVFSSPSHGRVQPTFCPVEITNGVLEYAQRA